MPRADPEHLPGGQKQTRCCRPHRRQLPPGPPAHLPLEGSTRDPLLHRGPEPCGHTRQLQTRPRAGFPGEGTVTAQETVGVGRPANWPAAPGNRRTSKATPGRSGSECRSCPENRAAPAGRRGPGLQGVGPPHSLTAQEHGPGGEPRGQRRDGTGVRAPGSAPDAPEGSPLRGRLDTSAGHCLTSKPNIFPTGNS